MEMSYGGALVMPRNFVEVAKEELEYIVGGMSNWQKAIVVGAVIAGGIALTAAIAYGQFWLAAKILGYSVKTVARAVGAVAVVGLIYSITKSGYGSIKKVVDKVLNL